jgi:hypothetical protein
MQLLRPLFCGLLAVLVAISFAPESLAHSFAHGGVEAALSASETCPEAQADAERHGEEEQAPGAPCQDCCHSSQCHMKAAPLSKVMDQPLPRSYSAKLGFGAPPRFVDAPEAREPDPERT